MNRRNFLKGLIALPAIGAMPLNVDAEPEIDHLKLVSMSVGSHLQLRPFKNKLVGMWSKPPYPEQWEEMEAERMMRMANRLVLNRIPPPRIG